MLTQKTCIETLQAGIGDGIWISHNRKNVVIDGGKSAIAIRIRYGKIPLDEIIDLLVVIHIDSDHIADTITLVKHVKENEESHRLKQVWFNLPKKEEADKYSITEGNELASLFLGIDSVCWNNSISELLDSTIEVGGMRLRILALDHDVADGYKPNNPDELGVYPEDWHINLRTLIGNVGDNDMNEGGPNSQSIIVLVKCEDKKLLYYCPRKSFNSLLKHL